MSMTKPFFITVDGIDGCGKTTIAEYITKKTNATYMKAFGQGPVGTTIRKHFLTEKKQHNDLVEFSWYFSANLETLYDFVLPTIRDKRQSVVLDRFLSSMYSYQISRMKVEEYKKVFCYALNRVLDDMLPDLYIWCDVNVRTSNERIQSRSDTVNHFDVEDIVLKQETISGFKSFYEHPKIKEKVILDCNQPLANVLADVDRILKEFHFL